MSVATITFKLPDEQEEYDCCIAAPQYERALRDIAENFRSVRKYGAPTFTEDMFYDILQENEVTL